MLGDNGATGTSQKWLVGFVGSGALTIFVSLWSLFNKEQTDVSALEEREKNHAEAINAQVGLIRIDLQNLVATRERTTDIMDRRINENEDNLGKRIDIVNDRLTEIQRQTSAIEGKLGESLPNLMPKRP